MAHGKPRQSSGIARLVRLAMFVLAMAGQIASAPSPAAGAEDAGLARLTSVTILCQGVHRPGDDGTPAHHRRLADQAEVKPALAGGDLIALAGCGPALPVPPCVEIGTVFRPGPRAPPARYAVAALPRGPPRPV